MSKKTTHTSRFTHFSFFILFVFLLLLFLLLIVSQQKNFVNADDDEPNEFEPNRGELDDQDSDLKTESPDNGGSGVNSSDTPEESKVEKSYRLEKEEKEKNRQQDMKQLKAPFAGYNQENMKNNSKDSSEDYSSENDAKLKNDNPNATFPSESTTGNFSKEISDYDPLKNKEKPDLLLKTVIGFVSAANPLNVLFKVQMDSFLTIDPNGYDLSKLIVPRKFFPPDFFTNAAKKTSTSIKQISNEIKADVNDPKAMINLGSLIKFTAGFKLDVRGFLELGGLNPLNIIKAFEQNIIQTILLPLQILDVFFLRGYMKGMFFLQSRGGLIGRIFGILNFFIGFSMNPVERWNSIPNIIMSTTRMLAGFTIQIAIIGGSITASFSSVFRLINLVFVPLKQIIAVVGRVTNLISKVISKIADVKRIAKTLQNTIGGILGGTGRAIISLTIQPVFGMLQGIISPLLLILRILFIGQKDILSRLLALPFVIIMFTGGLFKPILRIFEPILRLIRFLITGQFHASINAGIDVAVDFGFKEPKFALGRDKIDNEKLKTPDPKTSKKSAASKDISAPKSKNDNKNDGGNDMSGTEDYVMSEDEIGDYSGVGIELKGDLYGGYEGYGAYSDDDKKSTEEYNGGPPQDGYKGGINAPPDLVKKASSEGGFVARVFLTPVFLLKVGGNLFLPFFSVVSPILQIITMFLTEGTKDISGIINLLIKIPAIVFRRGILGPIGKILQALIPFLRLAQSIVLGHLNIIQILLAAPKIVATLSSGLIVALIKTPMMIVNKVFSFFIGPGGILAMLSLQFGGKISLKVAANGVDSLLRGSFGGFADTFGGIASVGSLVGGLFNGVLGNVVNVEAMAGLGLDLSKKPLKTILSVLIDFKVMARLSANADDFTVALTGGLSKVALKRIGIDSVVAIKAGIDIGILLSGGFSRLPKLQKELLNDEKKLKEYGINVHMMAKGGVKWSDLKKGGLASGDRDSLKDNQIDPDKSINRAMRYSILDMNKFLKSGINAKKTMSTEIDIAWLIGFGYTAAANEAKNRAKVHDATEESAKKKPIKPKESKDQEDEGKESDDKGSDEKEDKPQEKEKNEEKRRRKRQIDDNYILHLQDIFEHKQEILDDHEYNYDSIIAKYRYLDGNLGKSEIELKRSKRDEESENADKLQKKYGFDGDRLDYKDIDAAKLWSEGISNMPAIKVRTKMGIDKDKLMKSLMVGMNSTASKEVGIDLPRMMKRGVNPKLLITGGLRVVLAGDTSDLQKSMLEIGVDFNVISKLGINVKMITDIGISGLDPASMAKLQINPQMLMLGILSETGLDSLTGGLGVSASASIGVAASAFSIIGSITSVTKLIGRIPIVGRLLVDEKGQFTNIPSTILFGILGVDGKAGLMGFIKRALNGQLGVQKILSLINPLRLITASIGIGVAINVKAEGKASVGTGSDDDSKS